MHQFMGFNNALPIPILLFCPKVLTSFGVLYICFSQPSVPFPPPFLSETRAANSGFSSRSISLRHHSLDRSEPDPNFGDPVQNAGKTTIVSSVLDHPPPVPRAPCQPPWNPCDKSEPKPARGKWGLCGIQNLPQTTSYVGPKRRLESLSWASSSISPGLIRAYLKRSFANSHLCTNASYHTA